MVSPKKRPKRSKKPVDRLNIASNKGASYVDKWYNFHIICCILYAPPAVYRILEAQLILLVVTIQICPLASILLIIMLLLLNAAKTFCTLFPYRSPFLCHPLVVDFPLVWLWTSETGGVVICLASTLMVLDHSVGSSRRPRVGGTDHDRPVGHSLQIL